MAINFRSVLQYFVPSWLGAPDSEGAKVLLTITTLIDGSVEHMRQALEARFPSYAGDSALKLIGKDRGIVRGRSETAAHYAARLKRWRYPRGHRVRGSAFAFLEQLAEYWGGVHCWTIDVKGNLHDRTAAGVESYSYGNPWNWDGVAPTPRWGRWWTVLDVSPLPAVIPWPQVLGAYGNSLQPGRGLTIGQQGVTPEDCRTIKGLLKGKHPWKPSGTLGEWLIVSFDGSPPVPDGGWLTWQGRDPAFRYWSLHQF